MVKLKQVLTEPSEMHDGMRLVDMLAALAVMVLGVLVRLRWDTDWSLLSFPGAFFAIYLTRRYIPNWRS